MKTYLTNFISWGILIGLSAASLFVGAFAFRILWEALKFGWTLGNLI